MRLPNRPPACLGRPTQVYLTDLCDEQDAEAACERAVEQALAVGGPKRAPLPEALQASANLRISQCRPADAAAALARVVQHIAQAVEGGELEALPSHDFRTTTAKLLLEVGEAESACDVLEQLLLEVRPRMGRRSCCPRGREARPGPTSPCRAPARSPRCCAPACAATSRRTTSRSCATSLRSQPCALATRRARPGTPAGSKSSSRSRAAAMRSENGARCGDPRARMPRCAHHPDTRGER